MQPLPAAGKVRGQSKKLKFGKQKAEITEAPHPKRMKSLSPGLRGRELQGREGVERGESRAEMVEGRLESGWGEEMVE